MRGQYSFSKDIQLGEFGESVVRDYMIFKKYQFIEKLTNYKYDLKMLYNNIAYTYEVKTDVYPVDTGNIVIEFECRDKPSGIAVTEADYFVTYFLHFGEIWNIRTDKLRYMINYFKPRIFEKAGDAGSNTRLYGFRKKEVEKFFKIHKNLPIYEEIEL